MSTESASDDSPANTSHPFSQSTLNSSTKPESSERSTPSHPRYSASNASGGRKRKVPDSVTPNACTNCKKARAKCDGAKPECKRCTSRNALCHYEIHAKTAKEEMAREIRRLQKENKDLEEKKSTLGKQQTWTERIMLSLKDNGRASDIVVRLKRGDSHQMIAEWLGQSPVGSVLSPTVAREIERFHTHQSQLAENHDPRYWTEVTHDAGLITHLVRLYLTWIHPAHMLFDEDHFMQSFNTCSNLYCAPALVSVICALSTCLLHEGTDGDESFNENSQELRDNFMTEAQTFMRTADSTKMTTLQTYAIMFLIDIGSGHGNMATSHLRFASESLIAKQNSDQSSEAEEISAWGILTLLTAWSGLTYQKPPAPISTGTVPFDSTSFNGADHGWCAYTQSSDIGNDKLDQPSFSFPTAVEHAKLFRIFHEMILVSCGSRGRVSAPALLGLYQRCVEWMDNLPSDLEIVGDGPCPHILTLHIQYYCGLLNLLQPMLHLDHFQQGSYQQLRHILVTHANTGLDLLVKYRNLYSYRYLSPLHLFYTVHICDALARYDTNSESVNRRERSSVAVIFCLTSLEQAKVGFPVAGPLQKMFLLALNEYGISIPSELEREIRDAFRFGPEALLDACTRQTYRQPLAQLLPNMEAGIGQRFIEGFAQVAGGRMPQDVDGRGWDDPPSTRIEVGSLLNS